MASFSSRLKKLRNEYDLSQKDLAKTLGYSRATIANYEQGVRKPSADILREIANYFEVSLDYLLGRSNIRLSLKNYLTQSTPSILLFINPENGKIVNHSPYALSFYGYSREELLNKTIFEINILPKDKIKSLLKEAKNKNNQVFHFKHKLANGEIKEVISTTTKIMINDQIIIGSLIQDITPYKRNIDSKKIQNSLITAMGNINQYKTPYKKYHSDNVANLSFEIGKKLSLPHQKLRSLKIASLLHDVGEVKLPDDILNKPDSLTENEYNLIKEHPKHSYNIINDISFEESIEDIALQHHERLDGSGYPNGLTKNNIFIEAKIIAVADVVEAMTSKRPYRNSFGLDNALDEIKKYSNEKYDKEVVETCINLFKNNSFSF